MLRTNETSNASDDCSVSLLLWQSTYAKIGQMTSAVSRYKPQQQSLTSVPAAYFKQAAGLASCWVAGMALLGRSSPFKDAATSADVSPGSPKFDKLQTDFRCSL